jgi:hypothetical protein
VDIGLFIFTILISAVLAKLEIQIEGKNGWAGQLPTWRISNIVTSFVLGDAYHPLTGYHFYLGMLVAFFFHFPFVAGIPWTLAFELKLLAMFFLFWLVEDFLWFVFNPHYGFFRFTKSNVPWHSRWVFGVPFSYYKFFLLALLLYVLSIILV